MFADGSAISPEEIAESGAHTIAHARQLPRGPDGKHLFSERQVRRVPGVLFPVHRPGAHSEPSWSFRPDASDPDGPRYEQPPKSRGGAGNVLAVLPSQRHLVDRRDVPAVFVEGQKKQLSLISALRAAGVETLVVGIVGCWNWMADGQPIADLERIALAGRRATITFDSDMLRKVEVQDAVRRLAGYLEDRGAQPFVTFFRDGPDGSKVGADDFFAAGGTLAELRALTRRYNPEDFQLIRLSRDEKLRVMLEDLERTYEAMPAGKIGECSDRATMRALRRRAGQSGEATEVGIIVRAPSRTLANQTHTSQPSQLKSLARLERDGYLERIEQPKRKTEKRGAAYLLYANCTESALSYHHRTEPVKEQNVSKESKQRNTDSYADSYAGDNLTRASAELAVPELRYSKCVHTWAWRDGRRVVVDSEYVYRLAKPRQEIVMYLLEHGGEASVAELLERFGSKRTRMRDFVRRRILPLAGWRYTRDKETGVERRVEVGPPLVEASPENEVVRLLPEWGAALQRHRTLTGEIEDNARQEERYRNQSKAYRNRDRTPAGEEGPLKGKEEMARILERQREEARRLWVEEQRRKVGQTAATFLADELSGAISVRFKDVRERWMAQRGRSEDLRLAVHYGPFILKRYVDGDLYIEHVDGRQSDSYDRMVAARVQAGEARRKANARKLPSQRSDGVYVHPPKCDCWICGDEVVA
jgi:hypothetical protein